MIPAALRYKELSHSGEPFPNIAQLSWQKMSPFFRIRWKQQRKDHVNRLILAAVITMMFFVAGCQQEDTVETDLSTNKQIVKDFWKAFSNSDVETAMSLMHEDGTWWIQGDTDISGIYTKTQYTALVNGVGDNTENGIQVTFKEMTAEDNRVAVEAESYGVLKNGKIYQNTLHLQHVIVDGKLMAVREYLDTRHVQETFGQSG